MIDPTVEMAVTYETVRRAYWDARDHTAVGLTVAEHGREACLAGLAAVFAVVERDYEVRAHCNDELMPGVVCKRMRHGDDAGHYAVAPGGSGVSWQ